MSSVFDKIRKSILDEVPEAKRFLSNAELGKIKKRAKVKRRVIPGTMAFFEYDAINADTLPYWDKFPLMIYSHRSKSKEGKLLIHGINVHYMPMFRRVEFLKAMGLIDKKSITSLRKKLKEYEFFQHHAKLYMNKYSPWKTYRVDHVKSGLFTFIERSDWNKIIYLPVVKWIGGRPYSGFW